MLKCYICPPPDINEPETMATITDETPRMFATETGRENTDLTISTQVGWLGYLEIILLSKVGKCQGWLGYLEIILLSKVGKCHGWLGYSEIILLSKTGKCQGWLGCLKIILLSKTGKCQTTFPHSF